MEADCLLGSKCLKEINEQSSLYTSNYNDSTIALNGTENVQQLLISMHYEQTTSSDINNDHNESFLDNHLGLLQISYNTTTTITNNTQPNQNEFYEIKITDLIFVVLFCLLIIITVIGNTLVILSVITTRRLRTVTNCFVMSLAVADWLVGIFVMPPAVAYYLMGSWYLGWILCDIWISLDVLLCTASILSLCAISIDRYLAVTQPLNYSRRRRSKRLAMLMILVVWILALAITCPPILGWYEPGRKAEEEELVCRYNQNKGYVVFSAMGSFFLPMLVMVYVYLRISCVVANRHDDMVQIKVHQNSSRTRDVCINDYECESDNENRGCSASFRHDRSSGDQIVTIKKTNMKKDTPIPPDEDLVKSFKQLEQDESRNGHYELIQIGKIQSEPMLKCNNTNNSVILKHPLAKDTHWCRNSDKSKECKHHTHSSSLTNINSNSNNNNNNNNNPDNVIGNQQLSSANFYIMRSRTQSKSLSTRISSIKRESKTTRTLSIVMFTFIACWLPFFIQYLLKPFYPELNISLLEQLITWLGWVNSAMNPFIYAFYSEDFRAAFYRLTLRKFCISAKKKPYGYPLTSLTARRREY